MSMRETLDRSSAMPLWAQLLRDLRVRLADAAQLDDLLDAAGYAAALPADQR